MVFLFFFHLHKALINSPFATLTCIAKKLFFLKKGEKLNLFVLFHVLQINFFYILDKLHVEQNQTLLQNLDTHIIISFLVAFLQCQSCWHDVCRKWQRRLTEFKKKREDGLGTEARGTKCWFSGNETCSRCLDSRQARLGDLVSSWQWNEVMLHIAAIWQKRSGDLKDKGVQKSPKQRRKHNEKRLTGTIAVIDESKRIEKETGKGVGEEIYWFPLKTVFSTSVKNDLKLWMLWNAFKLRWSPNLAYEHEACWIWEDLCVRCTCQPERASSPFKERFTQDWAIKIPSRS